MIIDDLPEITIANDTDEIAIEQGTSTKKIKKSNFLQEVTSAITSLVSSLSGKVSKSGDTMTGNLNYKNSNIDTNVPPSSATTWGNVYLKIQDKNGNDIGRFRGVHYTDGRLGIQISSHNGNTENALRITSKADGTRDINVNDPAAWRNALGLGEIAYGTTNTSNIRVPTATATEFASLTLTTGVWVIVACGDWEGNATGYRQIAIGATATNPGRSYAVTADGISSAKETYQQLTSIRDVTGTQTFVFYGLQNSGSTLLIHPYVYAVRVG